MSLEENPYIIGRPIYEQKYFFGREDLFQFIQTNLRQQAKVIVLYGQRRIGKSSVLAQIPNFVRLEQFAFIPLSLEGKSQKSLNVVLRELALEIKDYLTSGGIATDKITLPSRQESQDNRKIFSDHFLPNVYEALEGQKLVLLIDEFDVLGDYSEESAANHFFPYLQSILYQQEKLFIIPVVGRRLEDMPNLLGLFRQAPKQEIGRLKANYATRLITEPAKASLDYTQDAIQAILELSAGHPYFTQLLCSALFSYVLEQERRQVTREDVERIVNEAIELGEGGLAWFRDGLPPSERVIFSASSEIQEEKAKSQFTLEEPLSCLERYGVIRTDQINKATRNLVDWDFWQKALASNSSTAGIVTYKVTIELVRRWLIKRHPLRNEIWELENSSPEALQVYKLADASYEQGDIGESSKLYEQVLELNPNYFSALLKLSEIYLNTEAFDQAAAVYSRAYKVDPARTRAGFLQASLSYSQSLIQTGEQDETLGRALELYVEAYKVDPLLVKKDFSKTLLNYKQNLAIARIDKTSPFEISEVSKQEALQRLQKEPDSLAELLQRCTVRVNFPNENGWGTGFFVAPGVILTCAHVVKSIDSQAIIIQWGDRKNIAEATVDKLLSNFDLVLLKCNPLIDFPCVYLDEIAEPGDNIYSFGYSDNYPNGAPVTLECEGFTGDYPPFIVLKSGQIRPGMSGAPLLNQRSGKVCGILKFTRGRTADLGGGGIPTSVIFSAFPELKDLQQKFHQIDTRWAQLIPPASKRLAFEKAPIEKRPRNLQLLIRVVKQEVYSRLEQSLNNAVLIKLAKETQPKQVKRLWDSETKIGSKLSELIPESVDILQVFDNPEIQGSLLILGQPGAGKTTTLLDLARALIQRAEDDLVSPIPVLFNLSSWTDPRQEMQDWLVEELKLKYGVRADIAKKWLQDKQLLPLLDGLDEVKPGYHSLCVQAINQLLQSEYRPLYLVVCDRLGDYEAYQEKLQLNGAVYLKALTNDQIQDFLIKIHHEKLWQLFNDNPTVLELVRTPLLLNIATLISKELSVQGAHQLQTSSDPIQYLMDTYVEWMLAREIDSHAYSKQRPPNARQLRHWLGYLAQQLQKESRTDFLIEEMQPSWLLNNKQKQIYKLISSLIIGFISGLSAGLFGLFFGLNFAIIGGLITGLAGGLIDRLNDDIRPVETLKFSWTGLGKGSILVVIGGFIGVLGGPLGVLIGMIVSGAFISLRPGADLEAKTFPNQGIRRSAVNALVVSLFSFLFVTTLGILVGLMFGGQACVKHFALRLVLYYYDRIPWNYARFLDYATERLLLQRTGGRYRFLHRSLQSYFASMPLERY